MQYRFYLEVLCCYNLSEMEVMSRSAGFCFEQVCVYLIECLFVCSFVCMYTSAAILLIIRWLWKGWQTFGMCTQCGTQICLSLCQMYCHIIEFPFILLNNLQFVEHIISIFFIGSVCISTTSTLPPKHPSHWSSPSHPTNC